METLQDAIKHVKENTGKKKFTQSVDLVLIIRNIDLKKPENKISKEVVLPHFCGKDKRICMISESNNLGRKEIEAMTGKDARKFCNSHDYFLCEAQLMPIIGKSLGKFLAPKGKMPKLVPPGKTIEDLKQDINKTIKIRLRESAVVQVCIGNESMDADKIKDNVEKITEELKKSLPAKSSIKYGLLKTTMGKPVKFNVM